ncbi:MAG: diheme cytochrome c [Burkholderiaceae bacterium]|nr:diheme cytochrome c [Burkholderiaceae bacterium]
MKQHLHALVAMALAAGSGWAQADERGHLRTPMSPDYSNECASCHVAYAPGLLPAPSWQRLMDSLSNHFGTDASLEPATQASLTAWLTANAGSGRRTGAAPPQDRITRSAWFEREHRRIAASVWQRPSIKGASNCSACHRDAAAGDFEDDRVVIPR